MRKHELPFIVTSNLFLVFPMVAAFYVQEWIYLFFTVCIFVASIGFHYTFYHNKNDFSLSSFLFKKKKYKSMKAFRVADWAFAIIGSLYVFNYIYMSPANDNLKGLFAFLFMATLLFFFYTFKIGNYNKYHPWFHVFSQTVLGFIVLVL